MVKDCSNIVVILQARIGSTRLPRKVMNEILGKPVLIHDSERINEMKTINKIVVATTNLEKDDIIVKTVKKYNKDIGIFRGSENDVLDRYYKAAKEFNADIIVRITSDDPLIDPKVSDLIVRTFLDSNCDYCCNNMPRTFPLGLDTEVFTFEALERAWKGAKNPYEIEHVTPCIRENPDKFKRINVRNNVDLSNLRWTLDYPEDFEFITEIYKRLYPRKRIFYMVDVLDVLNKEPWLIEINQKYVDS